MGKKGALGQADNLVTKIGSREKKNTQIIAFTIACCLAILIYHYNFLGLGIFKGLGGDSSTASPGTP